MMKTVEEHLEDASSEVRQKVGSIRDREPTSLNTSLHYRRVSTAAGSLVLVLALIVAPQLLFTGGQVPPGLAASQPSTPDEPTPGDQITFEQYEAAYTGYVECLRDAGYTVEGPLQFGRDPEAPLALSVGSDPTIHLLSLVVGDVEKGPLDAADDECRELHIGDIEERWLEQESAEFIDTRTWLDNLLACAESNGIEIPESLSYEEMLNDVGIDPSDDMVMSIAAEAIRDHGCRPWQS